MARATRFRRGSSGSTKHTEHYGDGSALTSSGSEDGPRIGAGALGRRVTANYAKDSKGNGRPAVRSMSRYSEE